MINKNLENNKEFFIDPDFYKNRKPGISAMLRVGDEEEFIRPSIESVLDFFDEIVVILNNPRDNTEEMIRQLNSEKIKIYYYPHELFPNGPGHDKYPDNSLKEISYYYNWSLAKTNFSHVCKWDGDMVALPNFKEIRYQALENDILFFGGLNITGENLNMLSKTKREATSEPRIFKVTKNTYYVQGPACEVFSCKDKNPKVIKINPPTYLHYKHAKNVMSQTKVWPKDWIKNAHFLKIYKRKDLGDPYEGPQPEAIKKYFPEKFKERNFVFIHIPKTAGQSIKKVVHGKIGGPHLPISQVSGREDLFSFSFVRNPWDRLYSAFCYLSNDGCGNPQDRRLNNLYFKKFNKDFEHFVMNGLSPSLIREVIHLRPQNYFLCDSSGKIMVDFVGRYENLHEDLSIVLSKIGMQDKLKELQITNKSKKTQGYLEAYNKKMIKKVADLYRSDIEIFNYGFENE